MLVGKAISQALQGVSKLADAATEETPAVDFDTYLKGMLTPDAANNVSEEELFSALMSERLKAAHGQEVSDKFNEIFSAKKTEMMGADGFVPYEDAAKEALKELRNTEYVTAEEADKIYSESFAGAQLDGNKDALFDNRGGAGDDTIAVSLLEQALLSARTITEKFDAGEEVEMRSLDEASNSKVYTASPVIPQASTETEGEDTSTDAQEVSNSDNNTTENIKDNIPALELALGFSSKILGQDLNKTLLDSLSKDKDKAL